MKEKLTCMKLIEEPYAIILDVVARTIDVFDRKSNLVGSARWRSGEVLPSPAEHTRLTDGEWFAIANRARRVFEIWDFEMPIERGNWFESSA